MNKHSETDELPSLPFGMTKTPYCWPAMAGAFMSCAVWAASKEEIVKAFEKDTGWDVRTVVLRSSIEKMVDEATGRDREFLGKWYDWVAENIFGEDPSVT